jgi:predicted ATP-grasp superfamily ATP-dependent carboligase
MRRIFVHEALSAQRGAAADAALLAAGCAMRDAVVLDLLQLPDVEIACSVGDGPGRALPLRHPRLHAVRDDHDDAVAFVRREQAHCELAWIVAPETGGELERLQAAVDPARRLGCEPGAIRIAASKRATLALMAAHGLRTPRAFEGADGWIVKPDDGAGTTATRWHALLVDAHADQAARPGAALEPFVPGEALSVALVVVAGSARAIAFNRQDIATDADGRLEDRGVEPAALHERSDPRVPALRALADRAVRALPGLRGFVGIDVVWHAGSGPVLIEVNPRTTCAIVGLSQRLGRNVAREVLDAAREGRDVAAH